MSCWLGGVSFNNVTMAEAVAAIVSMAQKSDKPCLVCTANLDHLAVMQDDGDFRRIYREADFVVADGMPLVWLSKLAGTPLKERVAGSDLFWELGRASDRTGVRLFLLGGQPTAADKAAQRLRQRHPGAQVCGVYCPPLGTLDDAQEEARIREIVIQAQPDILLVGFGSPRQEKWIASHRDLLRVPVSIGVGATFDMAAGLVRRAPEWARSAGLEWIFRLLQEPRRLWRRYMGRDLRYLWDLTALALRVRMRPEGRLRDEITPAEH